MTNAMGRTQILAYAYRALKRKQALEAISLLEDEHSARRDPYVSYYLGIAYLYHGKIAAAAGLIADSQKRFPDFLPLKEVLAFAALKAGSDKEAVLIQIYRYYQDYPQSRKIRTLIKRLKKVSDFDRFQRKASIQECIRLVRPPKHKRAVTGFELSSFSWKALIPVMLLVLLAAGIFIFIKQGGNRISVPEEALQKYRIDTSRYPLVDETVTDKRYTYSTEKKLLEDYEKARQNIQKGELNSAVMLLNKILMSNANMSVKDRSSFLKDFIVNLPEKNYDEIPFDTLLKDPDLYAGSFVSCSGKAANTQYDSAGNGVFTLLVNEENDSFDATVEIISDLPGISVENGERVVVKGEFLKSENQSKIALIRAMKIEKN